MSDDDAELFEHAMAQLGTKRSARAAPRPKRSRPEGVTVTAELDFDALMREGHGPAEDLEARGARRDGEAGVERAEPGWRAPIEEPERIGDTRRYQATEAEAEEFLEAMADLGTPPTSEPEPDPGPAHEAGRPPDLARRLRRGEVESEAVLDLHGATRAQAHRRLIAFVSEAQREGWEIVTIVVGRGRHSRRGEAVLRPLVEQWLTEDLRDAVAEVHQAPSYLGGSGAWVAAIRVRA